MSDMKNREESRVLLGLVPKHYTHVKSLTKAENTWERVVFLIKINSFYSDVIKFELPILHPNRNI